MNIDIIRIAKKQFYAQRGNASKRSIDWNLSLEEYIQIWQSSGVWDKRGKGPGRYVMSRFGDKGSYSIDNVFIQSWEQNTRDAFSDPKKFKQINLKRSLTQKGRPIGSQSEQHRLKNSQAAKNRIKLICPHCNKAAQPANAHRWHFENCKIKGI